MSVHLRRRYVACCLALILLLLAGAPSSASTPVSNGETEPTGRLVFVSNRDGNDEIYIANADGSHVSRLTHTEEVESSPILSPDGSQIVFTRTLIREWAGVSENEQDDEDYDSVPKLFIMDVDGSDERRLTKDHEGSILAQEAMPAWSPDGRLIAFQRYGYFAGSTSEYQIYTITADGRTEQLLGELAGYGSLGWSPDSSTILIENGGQLLTVQADGSPYGDDQFRLIAAEGQAGCYSPDGRSIAYHSIDGGVYDDSEIWIVNADGTDPRQLTDSDDAWADTSPVWTADGRGLYFFRSSVLYYRDLADGSEIFVLGDVDDSSKPIAMNGTWIAVAKATDDNLDLYAVSVLKNDPIDLTNAPGIDYLGDWQQQPYSGTVKDAAPASKSRSLFPTPVVLIGLLGGVGGGAWLYMRLRSQLDMSVNGAG